MLLSAKTSGTEESIPIRSYPLIKLIQVYSYLQIQFNTKMNLGQGKLIVVIPYFSL